MAKFRDVDVPDLRGRRALVTGASDGIGLELARRLAAAGADLVLPFRTPAKGAAALARLRAGSPGATITSLPLDLASQASVRGAAEELLEADRDIDLLIANAGIMTPPAHILTEDGFELQMATNHLGHAAFIGRLFPLLRRSRTRITSVSSAAAGSGRVDPADLRGTGGYAPVRAYGASKLAQLLFALELDRRSRAHGWGVVSNAAHPGTVYTNLYSAGPNLGRAKPSPVAGVMRTLSRAGVFVQTPRAGALPALLAATRPEAGGGRFYGPDGPGHFTGSAAEQRIYRSARDPELAARVWEATLQATGVDIPDTEEARR
ncbi:MULTISPECIES: SDR family oxidoreductase [unclassified Nocardiopsis]|uniref:SDR family oxidoreductase n=2 Tax=Nocardiopsidaceae TaxID=83676 RepID=UPI00387B7DCC